MKLEGWDVERATRIGGNGLILGLWLWLYRPVFGYLGIVFSRDAFRTNQVMLVGVLVLIVWQLRRQGIGVTLDAAPGLFVPGLALALGSSALYLVVERFLDVNTLSASLFGLASYGLLGLWMGRGRWREGLPAALLLIGTLPFGEHMETFIGYPMRLLSARIVRDGLAAAGASSVGVDTILVLEDGVSHVDLPCSGVRSLWSGALFFVAATWVDGRRVNLRWLMMALYEVYQNQTWERQEVVYYFNLPESAVITGLWLGNSDDRDERFAYRVAPRGAAQAVYRNEVRRRVDPALVEQIGPRQYRLRIFPVGPRRRIWDGGPEESAVEEGPPLHMWLTYRVMADGDAWPLPQLAEKRGVYWDGSSIREVNGEPMGIGEEAWLPRAVGATGVIERGAAAGAVPGAADGRGV